MVDMTATRSKGDPIAGYTAGTAYVCHGDESAPVMIFIHGVGMNKLSWQAQMQDFSQDYRVIAYDMLGHGQSDMPPEPTCLSDLTAQLCQLMDQLQIDKAHIIGHSMGALVAIEFALTHPESVDRLIALNAVYQRGADKRVSVLTRAKSIAQPDSGVGNDATINRWFTPEERQHQPKAIEQIRQWLGAVDKSGYARIYWLFATSDRVFINRLHQLRAPALFMTGSDDPNSTPEMSQRLAAESREARSEIIQGERHMMAYISPDIINSRIRSFLVEAF